MNERDSDNHAFLLREAVVDDLPALIALLADDRLGQSRESEKPLDGYRKAFAAIEQSELNTVLVAVDEKNQPVAMAQLTFTPGLSYGGLWRATVESVRVRSDWRGNGLGSTLLRACIAEARSRGCRIVQLNTHRERPDALRFYQRLGFIDSHHGLKLTLDD